MLKTRGNDNHNECTNSIIINYFLSNTNNVVIKVIKASNTTEIEL